MLGHGMRLVAPWLAAHMRELALRALGTLPKVEVEADGLVLGCPRMHALESFRDRVTR